MLTTFERKVPQSKGYLPPNFKNIYCAFEMGFQESTSIALVQYTLKMGDLCFCFFLQTSKRITVSERGANLENPKSKLLKVLSCHLHQDWVPCKENECQQYQP